MQTFFASVAYSQPYSFVHKMRISHAGKGGTWRSVCYGGTMRQYRYQNQPCAKPADYGPRPFAVNIEKATTQNSTFRTALWTGKHLQLTLMCINPGEDIGLENHPHLDQFLCLEEGQGIVGMGCAKNRLEFQTPVQKGCAIMIPAGTWHNLINTGRCPIKLFSIYAPTQHPFGTVHQTKAIAEAAESHNAYMD